MTSESKTGLAVLGLTIAAIAAIVVIEREDPAEREKREFYESYVRRMQAVSEGYKREKNRQIAEERYGDLWERDERPQAAGQSRTVQQFNDLLWVYDLSPEFLRAEAFGETLHVTVSAAFSRGWLMYPCSGQRDVVSDLFAEWKGRNADAHTVKLFNPGGGEIGGFSRLWGYHCEG